ERAIAVAQQNRGSTATKAIAAPRRARHSQNEVGCPVAVEIARHQVDGQTRTISQDIVDWGPESAITVARQHGDTAVGITWIRGSVDHSDVRLAIAIEIRHRQRTR